MTLLLGSFTIGLILALLALGVYLSFRIFNFPDITAEGSITLGASLTATLLVRGWGPASATAAGLAILTETAGLVGAALRRSPGRADATSPLAFPGVRDWLSFTTERTTERNLALIAGIASGEPPAQVAPFVRRIAPGACAHGHFHAALFPYRPVQRGELHLDQAIGALLGADRAQTLLHLLADDRQFEGVGQSEFMRGACWIGPISEFLTRST